MTLIPSDEPICTGNNSSVCLDIKSVFLVRYEQYEEGWISPVHSSSAGQPSILKHSCSIFVFQLSDAFDFSLRTIF